MTIKEIIIRILFIPFEFSRSNNTNSVYSLLQETGYFDVYNKITEKAILQELINYLDCIEYWLAWSEDKRSSNSWYFLKKASDKYVVGKISLNGQMNEEFEFDDGVKACSVFIKREIESIRMS